MVIRSLMFVPGHNERLMQSAARSKADVLLLDLEDSVQPVENKEKARKMIVKNIRMFNNFLVFPRINDIESGNLLKDLYALTIDGVHGFMFPKARDGKDIYFIDRLLEAIENEKKITVGTFKLIPLIETASAVLHAEEICRSPRVVAIAYGCEDFIADLQGITDSQSLFVPRAIIAMAARASGVIPIDTVHTNVHDLDDLRENLKTARMLGFEGMLVLHPKEIEVAHEYFTPTEEDAEKAREMLILYDQAQKLNKGVAILDGKFIGPPMVETAKKILTKYEKI